MKRIIILTLTAICVLSCSKFDDTELWKAIKENTSRIVELEKKVEALNTSVSNLKTIIDAINANDAITNVSEIADGSGYTIAFKSGKSIVIKHGKDGADGEDGNTPQISIKKDTDKLYYWTLDGEWLVDDLGNKILAQGIPGKDGKDGTNGTNGTNGTDGITPKFKIVEDYWYISYDNEVNWTKLGKAVGAAGLPGADGNTLIKSVSIETDYVQFILNDEDSTVLKLSYFKETKSITVYLDENTRLSDIISKAEAHGVGKITCSGKIYTEDINYLYAEFYTATDVDLSGCEYIDGTDYMDKYVLYSSLSSNPFQERLVEKLQLPKNVMHFEGCLPNLKKLVVPIITLYVDYMSAFDVPWLPRNYYYLYYPNGASEKKKATINTVKYSEGNEVLIRFQSEYLTSDNNGKCDTLDLPSTITKISQWFFFGFCNSTYDGSPTFDATCRIVGSFICRAVNPPALFSEPGFNDVKTDGFPHENSGDYLYGTILNPLYVPANSVKAYKKATGWKQFKNIYPIQ